jgi:hypothetical protein
MTKLQQWIKALSAPILVLMLFAAISFGGRQQVNPGQTPVQQGQPLFTCNQQATATGAGNTAVTATLNPGSLSCYICSVHVVEVANAAVTGAGGPAPIFTTTGLATNLVWWGDNSSLTTGQQKLVVDEVYPWFLKTAPGVPFAVVTSAGQSTQSVRIDVTGFFAP